MKKPFGVYSEDDFLKICNLTMIPASSTAATKLREEFRRVFDGDGTAEEDEHVTALLEQLQKAAPRDL